MTAAVIEREQAPAETGAPESANSRARRLWNGNSANTAEALLRELLLSTPTEEAIEVLLPWITDRVRAAVRADVRAAEAAAWGEDDVKKGHRKAVAHRTQTGPLPVVTDLQKMLELRVLVPGKDYVLWRDMTVDDHTARIGLLNRTVAGTMKTIGRHEWSIAEIRRHRNAHCLGDIPVSKLSKNLA